MKFIVGLFLLCFSCLVFASPFVVSDPYKVDPVNKLLPTHCKLIVDDVSKGDIPIFADSTGSYCKFDMAGLASGTHTIKGTHVLIDVKYGRLESEPSNPLELTKPSPPIAPGSLKLIP